MRGGRGVLAAALAILGFLGLVTGCGAPQPAPAPGPPPDVARILGTRQVQGRAWDLTVHSPALGKAVNVRLLLPVRFDAEPDRRWPLLYLLHGCCDDYDPAGATTDQIEVSIGEQNRAFAQHLGAVGTEATVDLYGAGTHNWVYWQRELHRAWPLLTADLLR